ncbi:MAG: hypothetical protein QM756_11040 [Polyangiaceae bacterium]
MTSPEDDRKPKPSQKRPSEKTKPAKGKKKQRSPEAAAAYQQLVEVYFEAFEACVGEKPPFSSRDGLSVWKLYDSVGLERAERCLRNAYGDEFGKRRTIRTIADDPGKFMGSPPRKANGHAPQQADAASIEEVLRRAEERRL